MEFRKYFTVTLLLLTPVCQSQSLNDTNTLLETLFTTNGYNMKIRPVLNQTDVLDVNVTFYLSAITAFDEQSESLTTASYLGVEWMDESLVWDPDQYNNTTLLFIPQDDIWKPDIALRNTFKTFRGLGSSYMNCWVFFSGYIVWYPYQIVSSTCSVDITYFPFDTQKCSLIFMAWSYLKTEINLSSPTTVLLAEYTDSSSWLLVNSDVSPGIDDQEARLIFTLYLQRKPSFYVINMILPVMLLSMLNLCTFILPVKSGERASYAITVFLSLAVFLTIVAAEFPKNSDTLSLLAVYLMAMISLSTFYVIASVWQVRLARRDERKESIGPAYMRMHRVIMCMRCKRGCRSRNARVIAVNPKQSEKDNAKESEYEYTSASIADITWDDVIDSLDSIFFWTGSFTTALFTVIIMAILTNNPQKVDNIYNY